MTNYFSPQQKLISKVRDGAKVIQKIRPTTHPASARHRPRWRYGRGQDHPHRHLAELNPAANEREIQAPADTLPTITTSPKLSVPTSRTHASANESTKPATRTS
jgi:hypothetical protein